MTTTEFRVRPVTRYVVTRYTLGPNSAGCETLGEFDNESYANEVCRVMGLEAYWAEHRGNGETGSGQQVIANGGGSSC